MLAITQFPKFAMKNRTSVELSAECGCFHCCKIFPVKEIKEYTDQGQTCICPHCQIDSVLANPELTVEILNQAKKYWFKP